MIEMQQELYRIQREAQNKYVHFLLAAVGACVAFALNQTRGEALSPAHLLLVIALGMWGLSFYYGCKHLQKVVTHILWNQKVNSIEVEQNSPYEYGRKLLEILSDEITKFFHRQFLFFIWGGLTYIAWHILEMALKNSIYATWLEAHFSLL